MDDDIADLITQLCTQIGMIMEDMSVIALGVAGMDDAARRSAIAEISEVASRITALSKAAEALAR